MAPVWGVDLKIVDDAGRAPPWDGQAFGHLLVRGPWIASGCFKGEGGAVLDAEGFFPTGDVTVRRPGQDATRESVLAFLSTRIAKWWLPDDVVFVDELPHTATGKLLKTALRERFRDHRLPTA